ncbi:type II toxin-antitoxin system HicA family toxin [Candidatus Palauibacter sp.]|uniref:type II toxin-antitoxin system HicA family toxin n=1 Tax=Candidatus Palauibacter sp. TaxID=3101350 RepID=UPI003AF2A511
MRTKHRKILARVHQKPTPTDLRWDDIRAMLQACGVEVLDRSGSRVGLRKNDDRIVIHRPHPRPVVGRETVRDIAAFLRAVGVEP